MKVLKLIASLVLPLLAGFLGSFATAGSINTWYVTLNKPSFNPPNWLFGPVWTLLYLLMGVALFLVWRKGITKENKTGLILFVCQIVLNTCWSLIFFGLRNPFYALLEIVVLWVFILLNIFFFYKVSKTAAYLLIPYILWVSFAAFLNYSIVMLN